MMLRSISWVWFATIALSVSFGCEQNSRPPDPTGDAQNGGDDDSDGLGDPGGGDIPGADYDQNPAHTVLNGPCAAEQRVGGFKVEMNEDVGYTAIDGVVRNGVVPGMVPALALQEGDCRLLMRRRLVCNPSCDPGYTCSLEENCVPAPVGQNQGMVTLYGLAKLVSLSPLPPGNTYFYTRLPHPGFLSDAVILLTSTSGYLGALELYGVGVSAVVPSEPTWVVTEGQPLTVHWTPPADGARSRVFLEINVDQHGVTPLTLTCDFSDNGSAVVPSAVIDGLIAAGVTGFPVGRVTRRTMDSTTSGDQCVDFMVSSVRQVAVEVTGHIPCASEDDCPPLQTCNLLIQQCE